MVEQHLLKLEGWVTETMKRPNMLKTRQTDTSFLYQNASKLRQMTTLFKESPSGLDAIHIFPGTYGDLLYLQHPLAKSSTDFLPAGCSLHNMFGAGCQYLSRWPQPLVLYWQRLQTASPDPPRHCFYFIFKS